MLKSEIHPPKDLYYPAIQIGDGYLTAEEALAASGNATKEEAAAAITHAMITGVPTPFVRLKGNPGFIEMATKDGDGIWTLWGARPGSLMSRRNADRYSKKHAAKLKRLKYPYGAAIFECSSTWAIFEGFLPNVEQH